MAVLAPMPSASVTIAATVNPELRARMRAPTRRSRHTDSPISNTPTRLSPLRTITTLLISAGWRAATSRVRVILTPEPRGRLGDLCCLLYTSDAADDLLCVDL